MILPGKTCDFAEPSHITAPASQPEPALIRPAPETSASSTFLDGTPLLISPSHPGTGQNPTVRVPSVVEPHSVPWPQVKRASGASRGPLEVGKLHMQEPELVSC